MLDVKDYIIVQKCCNKSANLNMLNTQRPFKLNFGPLQNAGIITFDRSYKREVIKKNNVKAVRPAAWGGGGHPFNFYLTF